MFAERGDVVRPSRRDRRLQQPFYVERDGQGNRAEGGHRDPGQEVARRLRQRDRERGSVHNEAGDVPRFAGAICGHSRDVRCEARSSDQMFLGESARSIVCRNVCAVTSSLDGGEKRNPRRMLKLYVRPSAETAGMAAAISGRSSVPG